MAAITVPSTSSIENLAHHCRYCTTQIGGLFKQSRYEESNGLDDHIADSVQTHDVDGTSTIISASSNRCGESCSETSICVWQHKRKNDGAAADPTQGQSIFSILVALVQLVLVLATLAFVNQNLQTMVSIFKLYNDTLCLPVGKEA